MRLKLLILTTICIMCYVHTVQAQSIKGTVVDNYNNSVLEFATISILATEDSSLITGGVTDAEGRFDISVERGNYLLLIEFLSYEPKTIGPIAAPAVLDPIALQSSGVNMDAIEVRAERSEMNIKLDKRVFNVGQDLAGRAGNAVDLLSNVPSVSVDVEGNVQLRGMSNVRILINGRPSGLTGISSADALRSLPANSIERVEVITNPSSKYEAEGSAGIVNIVLKTERTKGFNGLASLNTGSPWRYGGGINFNYRRKNINWFADLGYNYRRSYGGGYSNQTFLNDQEIQFSNQDQERNRTGWSGILRGGLDYYISDRDVITSYGLYRYSDDANSNIQTYRDFDINRNLLNYTLRAEDENEEGPVAEFSTRYDRIWVKDKHTLSTEFQFTTNGEKEFNFYDQTTESPSEMMDAFLTQRSDIDERENRYLIKTDYTDARAEDTEFSAGLLVSLRTVDNDYSVEELTADEWLPLPAYTDEMNYEENIYATYLSYGRPFGNFSIQGGLRVEHTDISTFLRESSTSNPRSFTDFFPSAHIAYSLSPQDQFQLSYSRRISRPRFFFLNPFITFADNRNVLGGNPDLNPEYSHKMEAGYLKSFESGSSLLFSLYYMRDEDVVTWITSRQDDLTFRRSPENIGARDNIGLETTFSHSFADWLRTNGDINLFYFDYFGVFEDQQFDQTNFTVSSRLNVNIKSSRYFDTQVRFNYIGPSATPQGTIKSISSVDLGFSRDFLSDKLRVTLNVRDLFNSRKRRSDITDENFVIDSEFQWRRRIMDIEIAYRINRKKSARERTVNDMLRER